MMGRLSHDQEHFFYSFRLEEAVSDGRGQAALRHQPTPGEQLVWGNAMPTSHRLTVIPGSKVSSTMRTFSGAVQRRRR